MEFIDIDGPGEAQSYLDRGYSVINNVSLVPMRLHAFQADLYAGKWAAVKGGNDYLDKLANLTNICVTHDGMLVTSELTPLNENGVPCV